MTHEEEIKLYVLLLEAEIEALRSVLSEWEYDKRPFGQWQKAEAVRELKNHLRRLV
jgi:hypothetical protein